VRNGAEQLGLLAASWNFFFFFNKSTFNALLGESEEAVLVLHLFGLVKWCRLFKMGLKDEKWLDSKGTSIVTGILA
jgi:hypothetical protein